MKRDERFYLQHILDAIIKTETYLRDIEATKRLSNQLRSQHDPIPWDDIAGMRDKLIHDYFGVDIDKVVSVHLPPFVKGGWGGIWRGQRARNPP
jgi:uncharacterized protein with HEPN domain